MNLIKEMLLQIYFTFGIKRILKRLQYLKFDDRFGCQKMF